MSALIPQCYQNIKLLYKNFSVFFCVCVFLHQVGPKNVHENITYHLFGD